MLLRLTFGFHPPLNSRTSAHQRSHITSRKITRIDWKEILNWPLPARSPFRYCSRQIDTPCSKSWQTYPWYVNHWIMFILLWFMQENRGSSRRLRTYPYWSMCLNYTNINLLTRKRLHVGEHITSAASGLAILRCIFPKGNWRPGNSVLFQAFCS